MWRAYTEENNAAIVRIRSLDIYQRCTRIYIIYINIRPRDVFNKDCFFQPPKYFYGTIFANYMLLLRVKTPILFNRNDYIFLNNTRTHTRPGNMI